jgi:hypothetical protein
MASGMKTGGRTKGTPNNRTQDVIEKLVELDCDPIEGMARIAQQAEADGDKNLAAQIYKELAPYVAPKRKAIEQTIKHEEELTREEVEGNVQEAVQQAINDMPEDVVLAVFKARGMDKYLVPQKETEDREKLN